MSETESPKRKGNPLGRDSKNLTVNVRKELYDELLRLAEASTAGGAYRRKMKIGEYCRIILVNAAENQLIFKGGISSIASSATSQAKRSAQELVEKAERTAGKKLSDLQHGERTKGEPAREDEAPRVLKRAELPGTSPGTKSQYQGRRNP